VALYKLQDSYCVTLHSFRSQLQRDLKDQKERKKHNWLKTNDCKKGKPETCENWKVLIMARDSSQAIDVKLKEYHGIGNIAENNLSS
jgi:hypothetical protein